MKECTHCGTWFAPNFDNVKLCFDCFKKREKALREYDGLIEEVAYLRYLLHEAQAAERKAYETVGMASQYAYQAGNHQAPQIPPDKLRTLIQLAHPDKHNGSQAANDVTAWLLSLRKERAA